MIAYCWANGKIAFGTRTPKGAIKIAEGDARILRKKITAVSRHAYDNRTLLVPGVPEAVNQNEGVEALIRFKKWIKPRFQEAGLTV